MLTKEIVLALKYGDILYHVRHRNADGTTLRVRVVGKCRVLKTRPEQWQLPLMRGLRQSFYIDNTCADQWATSETAAIVEGP